jgi:predicted dehydrogenase
MSGQPVHIGLIGEGPIADAYAAAGPIAGVEVVRANAATVLADPEIAGVICTVLPAALEALGQGKPVLLDPAALDSPQQLDEAQAAARTAGVALVVAQPWRFHPVAQSFRAAVDAGDLGVPGFFHWIDEGTAGWTADGQVPGAGPATSAGPGLDLALWLLGDVPVRVYARPTAADGVTISIRFQGGANALIEQRRTLPTSGAGYGFAWLLGPRGEVRWDQRADGVAVRGGQSSIPAPDLGAALRSQVAHANACWAGRDDAGPSLAAARRVLRVMAAANKSARGERPVAIDVDGAGR